MRAIPHFKMTFIAMPRYILAIILIPLLASCAGMKEIPLSDSSAIRGKSGLRTERDRPAFSAVTPGKAVGVAFGPIGGAIAGAAMVSSGNEIVQENGVEDPANWISRELQSAMSRKYGSNFKGARRVTDEKPASIASTCSDADFALDVRTTNWSLAYFPMDFGAYRVFYAVHLRIIDCKTGEIVAQGFYSRIPEKSDDAPNWDELIEKDNAARLKKELHIGAKEALHHFKANILKL